MTGKLARWATVGLLPAAAIATQADAAVYVTITQSGANVVENANGTLNLTGTTLITSATYTTTGGIRATNSYVLGGAQTGIDYGYTGLTGPANIGSGAEVDATSGSGDHFGFNINPVNDPAGVPRVYVDQNFVSGGTISASSALFAGTTLAALGLKQGSYVFSLPSDKIYLTIGAVPELGTWGMMITGAGMMGLALRRRRGVQATVSIT